MHNRPYAMEEVDPDEEKLLEIYKHVIGLILFYVQTFFVVIIAAGLLYFLLPSLISDTNTAFYIASIFLGIAALISLVVVLVVTFIYRQNRIIVTDRNITQVLQYGLFNRKVSQLNIANIEDVTSVQHGIVASFFNFGVLKIETAGEQSNFHFDFCPNSNYVAKVILDARERMLGQADPDLTIELGKQSIKNKVKRQPVPKEAEEYKDPNRHLKALRTMGAEVVEKASDKQAN